jgi:hypothetical protein
VVNPGAAGSTRTRGGASCLVLSASETQWTFESFRFIEETTQNTQKNMINATPKRTFAA